MLKVAALQMAMCDDTAKNVATADRLVRQAASKGAQIILIPELFEGVYFCKDMRVEDLDRALPIDGHPTIKHFQAVAKELNVVRVPSTVFGMGLCSSVIVT